MDKAREFQKNFCFIDSVDYNKLWKILRDKEYRTTLAVSWETCMRIKKQQLETDMEQWTGSKLGRLYIVTLLI